MEVTLMSSLRVDCRHRSVSATVIIAEDSQQRKMIAGVIIEIETNTVTYKSPTDVKNQQGRPL